MNRWVETALLALIWGLFGALGERIIEGPRNRDQDPPEDEERDCPVCRGKGTVTVRRCR